MGVDALMAELLFLQVTFHSQIFRTIYLNFPGSSDIKAKACKFVKTLSVKVYIDWIRALFQKLKVYIHISF